MTIAIVDTHTHVISTDTARFALGQIGGRRSDWSATRPIGHARLIAAMDAAGVAPGIVVQASTAFGHDNTYLADAIALYPRRPTGVFSVDLLAPDATAVIRHWHERGLSGFRLFTTGTTMPAGPIGWMPKRPSPPGHWLKAGACRSACR